VGDDAVAEGAHGGLDLAGECERLAQQAVADDPAGFRMPFGVDLPLKPSRCTPSAEDVRAFGGEVEPVRRGLLFSAIFTTAAPGQRCCNELRWSPNELRMTASGLARSLPDDALFDERLVDLALDLSHHVAEFDGGTTTSPAR
jgi:hypothetical protein